jgi:hypothetical protein
VNQNPKRELHKLFENKDNKFPYISKTHESENIVQIVCTPKLSHHQDAQLVKPDPLAQYSHLHTQGPASLTPSNTYTKHMRNKLKTK